MKKITVLIAVITVSIFVTNCSKPAKEECKQQFITYDGALLEELCTKPRDENTGELITEEDARKKLDAYKTFLENNNQDVKQALYGFYFGRKRLKELMKKIDKDSLKPKEDPEAIIGARVYLVISETGGKPHQDVLLVPVRRDGQNVVPIDPPYIDKSSSPAKGKSNIDSALFDATPVLNTSSPCPNQCN
ncbi:MAG TPA: hypothetical protein VD927_07210 [Chryseosolibacter sp.]|nr:hypothetical protein [Chryseosolibacter sp.]